MRNVRVRTSTGVRTKYVYTYMHYVQYASSISIKEPTFQDQENGGKERKDKKKKKELRDSFQVCRPSESSFEETRPHTTHQRAIIPECPEREKKKKGCCIATWLLCYSRSDSVV